MSPSTSSGNFSWNLDTRSQSKENVDCEADSPETGEVVEHEQQTAKAETGACFPSSSTLVEGIAHVVSTDPTSDPERIKSKPRAHEFAEFILRLKSRNVPQSVCDEVIDEFKAFSNRISNELGHESQRKGSLPVDIKDLPSVKEVYMVDSSSKLEGYAQKELLMVSPETIKLGESKNGKPQTIQFIPVTKQLEAIFSSDRFQSTATLDAHTHAGVSGYSDIYDGCAHKKTREKCISLILYYDEFTVSCPVGNKTVDYKIGGIYFTLGNLRQRSRLNNTHLALLFHHKYVKEHSWQAILRPLVNDLKILESQGITILWKGQVESVTGCVELLTGDNLGLHDIAGYFRSFYKTKRICRFCHASSHSIQSSFKESDFALRSKEEYEAEIRLLERDEFSMQTCRVFGIRQTCLLNELETFHIMQKISVDATHDLFEGIVLHTINLVLSSLLALRVVDGDMLNRMVQEFPFHQVDKNKPRPPRVSGKSVDVKQTCSEAWTLLRLLPLMIAFVTGEERLPVDGQLYVSIISDLIELVQLIMAETISEADVAGLQNQISDWLLRLREVYPDFHMTPKFHYLVHYPSEIKKHGPPTKYCTIRFESKHQELKAFLRSSKNRRNVCLTMARKHQLRMCTTFSDPSYLYCGFDVLSQLQALPMHLAGFSVWPEVDETHLIAQKVSFCGTVYSVGDVVVVKSNSDEAYLLQVEHLLVHSDKTRYAFVGRRRPILSYSKTLQAFSTGTLRQEDPLLFVKPDKLADFHPLGYYIIFGKAFVPLKIKTGISLK